MSASARPILFSAPMIRALLAGSKTQTRRIVKPLSKAHPILNLSEHGSSGTYTGRFNDPDSWGFPCAEDGNDMPLSWWIGSLCQYGKAGDLLWVRETWLHADGSDGTPNAGAIIYSANYLEPEVPRTRWRPSIHMPRTASRLTLRITDVRVQRLQDISPDDCVAEGLEWEAEWDGKTLYRIPREPKPFSAGAVKFKPCGLPAIEMYRVLWEQINGADSWAENPWIWAISFDVINTNVDQVLAKDCMP